MPAAQALISSLFKGFRLEDNGSIYDLFLAAGIPIEYFPVTVCSGTSVASALCCALPPFFLLFFSPPNFKCIQWKCPVTLHLTAASAEAE